MDYGSILRRAWRITWDHKYLWWLGLLTALGSGRPNFNGRVSPPFNGRGFDGLRDFGQRGALPGFGPGDLPGTWRNLLPADYLPILIAVLCALALLALAIWVLSTIARGGLIGAADQIEQTDQSSFGQGWRVGLGSMWRMLGVSLIEALPGLIAGVATAALLVLGMLSFLGTSGDLSTLDPRALMARGGVALACLVPLACILALVWLGLVILRPFADRACVLEDARVFASYRRGWEVLRDNFGESLVLGIIAIVVRFVVGLATVALFIIPLALAGVGVGVGAAAGVITYRNFAAPLIVGLLCGGLVLVVVAAFVAALTTTYFSSMWTLAYRQFTAGAPQSDALPADAPAPA